MTHSKREIGKYQPLQSVSKKKNTIAHWQERNKNENNINTIFKKN